LIQLHLNAIELLNQYRELKQIRQKDEKKFKAGKISEADYLHIKKYGYKDAVKNYQPHITLGYYEYHEDIYNKSHDFYQQYLTQLVGKKFIPAGIEVVSCCEHFATGEFTVQRKIIK
jgi:hypothetical protein